MSEGHEKRKLTLDHTNFNKSEIDPLKVYKEAQFGSNSIDNVFKSCRC